MDFVLDPEAVAVGDVADDVFARHETRWDSKFGSSGNDGAGFDGAGFDTVLWQSMAAAGLTTLAQPTELGGDGLGVAALMPLLARVGRAAGVVPIIGTVVADLVLASTDDPAAAWGRTTGDHWYSIAVSEVGAPLTDTPRTSLSQGRIHGTKTGVLHADGSSAVLVSTAEGVVAVPVDAAGVTLVRTPTSSGWGEYTVRFDGVEVGDDALVSIDSRLLRDAYRFALCAYADGLLAGALRLSADHVSNRTQFGKPIALFQAVGQQLADIYVVARSMNLATTAAAWRMSENLDAAQDLGIATYWLSAEVPATLRTMTHLHGGVGVDITYPLHRYFSIAKDLARLVGDAERRLDELAYLDGATSVAPERSSADVH